MNGIKRFATIIKVRILIARSRRWVRVYTDDELKLNMFKLTLFTSILAYSQVKYKWMPEITLPKFEIKIDKDELKRAMEKESPSVLNA